MKKRSIVPISLAVSLNSYAGNLQTNFERMDITMKFSKYEIVQGNFSNNLLAAMNRSGVYQDEQAGIQIK